VACDEAASGQIEDQAAIHLLTIGGAEGCRQELLGRFVRAVESGRERSMTDQELKCGGS
jgi:hypothetical protein